ncbi:MAG: rRNA maturation RNase YbeY, partial [Microbacteriaceae bacterium]|nr:rRNA maturation RNase YbeY [Microbacteriaceae bacterium]
MSIELNNESGVDLDEAALLRLAAFALDRLFVNPEA